MGISAATGYYLYAAEGYKRWLAAAILNTLVIPYTLFFFLVSWHELPVLGW